MRKPLAGRRGHPCRQPTKSRQRPNTASVVGDYILKLQDELNVTSVVVTHDIPLTRRVSDKVALLFEGKAVAQGPMDEVEAAGNEIFELFVAGQLG